MLYLKAKKPLCQQVSQKAKKLVIVLTTSMSMIKKKTKKELK